MRSRHLVIAAAAVVVAFAAHFAAIQLFPLWYTGGRADLIGGRTLVRFVVHWNKKLVPGGPAALNDPAELREMESILRDVPRVIIHHSAVGGGGIELTFSDGSVAGHGIYRRGDSTWGLIGIGDGGMGFSERWKTWCEAHLEQPSRIVGTE